jgi:AbiV family abortive infection protein
MDASRKRLFEATGVCVTHARDLLVAARAVHDLGQSSIAYHLTTLCLEELGRREMLLRNSVQNEFDKDGFPKDATYDHVNKLFWCFFRMSDAAKSVEYSTFLESMELAQRIHSNRLGGLYVDVTPDGLNIPSEQITNQQSERHLSLAEAFLKCAESQEPREVPPEEKVLQTWFMRSDDPERRSA